MSSGFDLTVLASRFKSDGVVQIKDFLNGEMQKMLDLAINFSNNNPSAMCSDMSGSSEGQFLFDFLNFRKNSYLKSIIFDPDINNKLAFVTENKTLRFFHDNLLVKTGNAPTTPWHQDRPHYVIDGQKNFSVWVCLDEVDEDNSLAFISGSHRLGKLFIPHSFRDGSRLGIENDNFQYLTNEKLTELSSAGILIYRYQPGDAIVFDNRVIHRALRGPGLIQRRAMALRFIGEGAFLTKKVIDPTPPMEHFGMKLDEGGQLDDAWFPLTYSRP